MNAEWYQCTEAERELIESCGPDETCVLFGERGMVKMPKDTWASIYGEAAGAALTAAMTDAGIAHTFTRKPNGGWTVGPAKAEVFGSDAGRFGHWDLMASTLTVRVRGADGREGVGVAHLVPPESLH